MMFRITLQTVGELGVYDNALAIRFAENHLGKMFVQVFGDLLGVACRYLFFIPSAIQSKVDPSLGGQQVIMDDRGDDPIDHHMDDVMAAVLL